LSVFTPMLNGPSFRHLARIGSQALLSFVFAALTFLPLICLAQQTPHHPAPHPAEPKGEASPAFAEAQELLGQNRLDEAKQKIQQQLNADPSSVEGYNLLGIILSNQKKFPDALEAFQQALRLNPKSVKTHGNLASFFLAEGKPGLAENEFKSALALAPADSDSNYNYGLFLLAKGLPSLAIVHLLRVHPPTVESRFHLVRA
jgi:Cytochrome c biogenesis factor